MNPLDGLWHVLGLTAPILVTGCLTALIAKLLWRRDLVLIRLLLMCGSAVIVGGLAFAVVTALVRRDGQMASYGALALGCATGAWLVLLRPRPG